ncbi:hypothetical protein SDC9_128678 [bioreactor metagenome]|jgi:transglutaminase-like putative cysteine protease|uniref:Transglutaminase family protein n=2 Tax=root TaxID=1 RepID=A0AAN0K5P8_9ACTN|nr:transglutaminase family protein [Brooklawnia sp. SH051]MCB0884650.1 transglutaminase family protein [Propionibacteriaceae bacterium]NLI86576.1 transglutaminase family protein [Propionibacterium sp.]BEH00811.1 transglutaminase family protein [Brooklawnia sp. SH051]
MATEHNDPRRYQVVHRTRYRYDAEVTASFARAFLVPRVTPHQQVLDHDVEISPAPDLYEVHTDFFGNHSHYVEIHTPHTQLQVRKSATLAVQWPAADLPSMTIPVDRTVELVHLDPRIDPVKRASYLLPSPLIELSTPVREFASGLLDPRMPVGEAIGTVYHAIYEGFSYTQGATTVATTLPEVINARAGVCQDFAHLAVASFRAVGLPARYVSGYIETYPPPGEEKLAGSDATHAWASVYIPERGWIDLDPTNDQLADSRYLVTAWGRDFRDVSPLKGVIFSESRDSVLDVAVDVTRLD